MKRLIYLIIIVGLAFALFYPIYFKPAKAVDQILPNPRNSPPWCFDRGSNELDGLLCGWNLKSNMPSQSKWDIAGVLHSYGADIDYQKPPDITITQEKDFVVICFRGITRKVPYSYQGYSTLVNYVVVEMAQTRLSEISKRYEREIAKSDDGLVTFKFTASDTQKNE